jgi:hypothetical protein
MRMSPRLRAVTRVFFATAGFAIIFLSLNKRMCAEDKRAPAAPAVKIATRVRPPHKAHHRKIPA